MIKIPSIPTKKIPLLLCKAILFSPFSPLALCIWLIRPWLVIRIGSLYTSRIGHFAGNTELYLCEKDAGINVPKNKFKDFFFVNEEVSNKQLLKMWKRNLTVYSKFLLYPVHFLTYFIPKGKIHRIGKPTQHDRDILHLLDKYPVHLKFTSDEEEYGKKMLTSFGIKDTNPFICLIVRDSAYLPEAHSHNYRDCDIDNYVFAAEELTKRGYYVIRMGAKVNKKITTSNPMIIDYATNGMRSDFMDIYLGAKCTFCISTSTGWDAIPYIFRKPIVFAPMMPLGYLFTFSNNFMGIAKGYIHRDNQKVLTFAEIFSEGVAYSLCSSDYEKSKIEFVENTADEIWDVVAEMDDRLNGNWQSHPEDQVLQERFWNIFEVKTDPVNGKPLHGTLLARFGGAYLRKNKHLLN
jgi:putative glycosyltransferase (TIGR04372 family)